MRSNHRTPSASGRFLPYTTAIILGASLSLSTADAGEPQQTLVAWPEKGLGLSLDLSGFKVDIDQVKPDGRRYLIGQSSHDGAHCLSDP